MLGADAVTANPYLGIGALAPFLDRTDRFTYLLCRTSNPESAELQSLRVGASDTDPEETLAERVARLAGRRAEGVAGRIGLVVGATDAAALRQVRAAALASTSGSWSWGAGGKANAVTADGGATTAPGNGVVGRGLLVNVGRGSAMPPWRTSGWKRRWALQQQSGGVASLYSPPKGASPLRGGFICQTSDSQN